MEPWDRELSWGLEYDSSLTSEGLGSLKLLLGGALRIGGGWFSHTS